MVIQSQSQVALDCLGMYASFLLYIRDSLRVQDQVFIDDSYFWLED